MTSESPELPPILRFGAFEIDTRAGELRKNGTRIKLQAQPFKLLTSLVARPGDIVTRHEIERTLWGNDTHVDFDLGLNYCIKQIRAALGDDAAKPRYIETLPRRGYRFITAEAAASNQRAMLAVLPLGNLTGNAEQEYFAHGLTEELISQLGKLNPQRLGVIAFTSALQYKNTPKGIGQIGRELNVGFILEGSVRRTGNRIRISTRLIQGSDQAQLWSEAYNRTVDDIIDIQIDVAERVAHALSLELIPAHEAAMVRTAARNSRAYDAYLWGRFYWNKRTETGLRKALTHFELAIQHDPRYALAYVGLADVYNVIAFHSGLPPREAGEKSKRALESALAIESELPEAQASYAYARLLYDWNFAGADAGFRRALASNPNQATGHYWYALFLAAIERHEEALSHIESALHLDPLSLVINSHKGWVLYFARRYDEAVGQLLNTIEMDENFALSRYFLGLVYLRTQRFEEAAAQFTRAIEISHQHPAGICGLAASKALAGQVSEARNTMRALATVAKQRYVSPYYSALVHIAFGEKEKALAALEKAFDERSTYLTNLKADPALDSIRSNSGFQKLIRRVAAYGLRVRTVGLPSDRP